MHAFSQVFDFTLGCLVIAAAVYAVYWVATHFRMPVKPMTDRQMNEYRKTHCSYCGTKLTTLEFKSQLEPDYWYCSEKCLHECFPAISLKPDPHPARVPTGDKNLLTDKSAPLMYFEPGRCAYCGKRGVLDMFHFCTPECRQNALRPYLPKDFAQPVDDDEKLKVYFEDLIALSDMSESDYRREIGRELKISKKQAHENMDRRYRTYKTELQQQKADQEHTALTTYVNRWEQTRDDILRRERQRRDTQLAKESERQAKDFQKQQEKQATEAAKREEERLEEERWKPRPFIR
jgi:hypothetical protein